MKNEINSLSQKFKCSAFALHLHLCTLGQSLRNHCIIVGLSERSKKGQRPGECLKQANLCNVSSEIASVGEYMSSIRVLSESNSVYSCLDTLKDLL